MVTKSKIKLLIVDDHPMIIDGLQNILRRHDHIDLIGSYTDGLTLMEGLNKELPDVLILDIQLPDKNGDELAPILLEKYPKLRLLTLTNFDSIFYIDNMRRHGVLGYLLKTTKQDTLIEAIETVYRGEEFMEPSIQEKIKQASYRKKNASYAKLSLTLREKNILQLLINGYNNHEIAEKLFISFNTVRNYRARIFSKLNANSIPELIKNALQYGLADYKS